MGEGERRGREREGEREGGGEKGGGGEREGGRGRERVGEGKDDVFLIASHFP